MRKPTQSDKWDYKVARIAAAAASGPFQGTAIPNLFLHLREDNGAHVGTASDDYGIIQNHELMDAARTAFDQRGLGEYKQKAVVIGRGEKFFCDFTFESKQLARVRNKGDVFAFKLRLSNSFDSSTRAAFSLGFLRLVCTNGMTTLEKEFAVTQKHNAKLNLKFIGDAIDKAIAHGQDALALYDELSLVEVGDEQGSNILKHLHADDVISKKIREGVEQMWLTPRLDEDKERSLYSLYNAFTDYLTHKVEAEHYEHANDLSRSVLSVLVRAARKVEAFERLTSVLVVDAPVATVTEL